MLVVLLLQIHRVLRHALLHPAEEDQPRVHSARHPSRLHAVLRLDGNEVRTRWSQHVLRIAQHLCAHRHVLLLYDSRDGSEVPEVHLVEEVPDHLPNGSIRCNLHASIPIALHRVQLPEDHHGMDRASRRDVPLPLLRLLQGQVQEGEARQEFRRMHAGAGRREAVEERQARAQRLLEQLLRADRILQSLSTVLFQRREQRLRQSRGKAPQRQEDRMMSSRRKKERNKEER